MKRVIAGEVAGWALWLFLAWEWLAIPDSSAGYLGLTAALGLVLVAGALWLAAAVLAGGFRASLRRLPKFALWALLLAAGVAGVLWLRHWDVVVSNWLSGVLTFRSRKAIPPARVAWIYASLVWAVGLFWTGLLLPFLRRAARGEAAGRPVLKWRYLLGTAALIVAGICLPRLLVGWVPGGKGLGVESFSMAVRFALAYAVSITALLGLAAWERRASAV